MKSKIFYVIIIFFLFLTISLQAQSIDDGLRYFRNNGYITPRSGALNVSFHGISDDISALEFNPAGLCYSGKSEFSVGFGFAVNNTNTSYPTYVPNTNNPLNTYNQNFDYNNEFFTHIGINIPLEFSTRKASIGIAYFKENDFANTMQYNIFNPGSTLINYYATQGPRNRPDNLAYELYLTDSARLYTPVKDSLRQNSFIQESGGLHDIVGGASFEINDNLSVGFTLMGKWGNFDYIHNYNEKDILNKYNAFVQDYSNVDFDSLYLLENLNQTVSGFSGSIGIMGKIEDFFRGGITIRFPTVYWVDENFSQHAESYFDDPTFVPTPFQTSYTNSYRITTPFVYCAGVSVHKYGLTLAAGIEYTDLTQIKFNSDHQDMQQYMQQLNTQIVQYLVGQTNWGFGAEYEVPQIPVVLRASYSSVTAPYQNDISGAALNSMAFGAGVYLAPNIRIDGLFRTSKVSQLRAAYGDGSMSDAQYTFKQTVNDIAVQLTYRY